MSLVIQIFRTDDYIPSGEIPLTPLLTAFFADVIGSDQNDINFALTFFPVQDLTPTRGSPVMENLMASHGFVQVRILRDSKLIYQQPHPVRELIGEPLREILRMRDPQATHWGYGIRGPGLENVALVRPVQEQARPRLRPTFSIEEIPEPDLPEISLAALSGPEERAHLTQSEEATRAANGTSVTIAIYQHLVTWLVQSHAFSNKIEEGGFLVGKVYRDADQPGGYLLHVTAALPVEQSVGSIFTRESFLRVSQQLETRSQGEQILGWYHTHLFAATPPMGPSLVDIQLHRSSFQRPWHIVGLVNITEDQRVLHFYHGEGDQMAGVPYRTVPGGDTCQTRANG